MHTAMGMAVDGPREARETEQVLNRISVLHERFNAANAALADAEGRLIGVYPDEDLGKPVETASTMFAQIHQALDGMERTASELSQRAHRINRL